MTSVPFRRGAETELNLRNGMRDFRVGSQPQPVSCSDPGSAWGIPVPLKPGKAGTGICSSTSLISSLFQWKG